MSTLAFLFAAALTSVAGPSIAHAQAPTGKAHVTVKTIHAKKAKAKSTAPEALVERLSKAFPNYGSFHLLGGAEWDLAKDKKGDHKLPTEETLSVTYLGPQDKHLRLRIVIPPKLKTEVRVKNGGIIYQAGMAHDGGILILSVRAQKNVRAQKK